MAQSETIDALKQKHASLEALLDDEVRRPMPDQGTISQIKRQKLKIKDQIAALQRP